MSKKKSKQVENFTSDGAFCLTLGEMLGKTPPKEKAAMPPAENEKSQKQPKPATLPKYSVGRQTAGRGGKVVTLVVFAQNAALDLEALTQKLRRALGCGAHVEQNKIVVQGDISERVKAWLEKNSC